MPDGPELTATVSRSGRSAVVHVTGELDLATAARLRSRLRDVLDDDPPPARVVMDLADLRFVDGTGIAVLVEAQRALAVTGGHLVLRSPSAMTRRVVRLLQLEAALPTEG